MSNVFIVIPKFMSCVTILLMFWHGLVQWGLKWF